MNFKIMSKKTILFFSIFLVVAVIGSLFIYFYRNYASALVDRYVSEITVCGNIVNEADCYARDFCEGIYGPSCPDCQDLEFQSCQRISPLTLSNLEKEKSLCQETGGEWYRNKLGNFCLCQKIGNNKFFDKSQGCVDK